MRLVSMILLAAAAAIATPAVAKTPLGGVWLFDKAPSYPGVTMVELSSDAGTPTGAVTTAWYGRMDMQNVTLDGDILSFDLRNLNDKAHATRRWTARLVNGAVVLDGDIWSSHVTQTGRRGTAAEAKKRAFKFTTLPPLGTLKPDGLAATPPMGWSSWNKFAENIDDRTIRAMADTLVSTGLREAGYTYVNIDDGWQGTRGPDGVLRPNAKFPDMKALADYVHARGLKLGIYSSQGPKTCAGYAGSYGHVAQDAKTFAGWGVDYLKYDLCSGEWFYADADTVKRSYYEMGAALRATGRRIVFSLCEYGRFDVGAWGRSVGGHLWRTTGDITDDYPTMAKIGFDKNGNPDHAGPGGWNDPDMLEIGNGGMSDEEYRSHMTLWAISAAPLVMGHDLRETSAQALALLKNRHVIAIDQDRLGIQGRPVRKVGDVEIWRKPLADGSVAVALFNRSAQSASADLSPRDAGLATVTSMRDVWRGAPVAPGTARFALPGHGSVLLRVSGS